MSSCTYVSCVKLQSQSLSSLPHFYVARPGFETDEFGKYLVSPYITMAVELQSIGRQKAELRMLEYAKTNYWNSDQLFILCRMLYKKPSNSDFRAPLLGVPYCLGETSPMDWPLNPIEIVNGVPFLIAKQHTIYGVPGIPSEYLEYCITNCDWNTFKYQNKSEAELESALNKLLNSSKWKRPLTPEERDWLAKQIERMPTVQQ